MSLCGQDLNVRNFVQDSTVQVRDKAIILGKEAGRRNLCLLGGTTVAGREIEATTIGSDLGRRTKIKVGVDGTLEEQYEKYQKGKAVAELRLRNIVSSLGLTKLDVKGMAEVIKNAAQSRRKFIRGQLKELDTLNGLRTSIDHHLEDMSSRREELLRIASAKVTGCIFQGVSIQVGSVYKELNETINASVFKLNDSGRIATAPISSE